MWLNEELNRLQKFSSMHNFVALKKSFRGTGNEENGLTKSDHNANKLPTTAQRKNRVFPGGRRRNAFLFAYCGKNFIQGQKKELRKKWILLYNPVFMYLVLNMLDGYLNEVFMSVFKYCLLLSLKSEIAKSSYFVS